MTNAFEAAANAMGGQGASTAPQTDQLTGNNEDYDPLFGGDKLISLFNKTHGVGTALSGVITKRPEDRQSRFYKANGVGALKFWAPSGTVNDKGEKVFVTDLERAPDGTPNRPCNDTVFVLQTEYRLTPAELAAKSMDADEGLRGVFASGQQLAAIRKAIGAARVSNRDQLVGMTLKLTRASQTMKGDFESWVWGAELSKP